jgi:predicted methyltransferase
MSPANGGTGVVLLEAYDADAPGAQTADCVNLSVRGFAGAGANVLTVGFVIEGSSSMTAPSGP